MRAPTSVADMIRSLPGGRDRPRDRLEHAAAPPAPPPPAPDPALLAEAVRLLYAELLGREPDAAGAAHWLSVAARDGIEPVRHALLASPEYRQKAMLRFETSRENLAVFRGYAEADLEILTAFADPEATAEPGFVVDFIGGRVRTSSLWTRARELDGHVLGLPVPGDYHAEAVEWIGVLKAVRAAGDRFAAIELGAGLGPWVIAAGHAARRRGVADIRLCAVEADPLHYRLMTQNFADNGFDPGGHRVIQAAVGASAGRARWPVIADSRDDWGTRPVPSVDATGDADYLGRSHDGFLDIDVVSIIDVLAPEERWDLCHVDVQGHEMEICRAGLTELTRRVCWLVLGTHSRTLEGNLIALFHGAGWVLEHEKPCKFRFDTGAASLEAMTFLDGVQVWRNPRLDRVA